MLYNMMLVCPIETCKRQYQRQHCYETHIENHNNGKINNRGRSVCEHSRIKSQCKQCKGGAICEHGRRKITCKSCKGTGICEHDRVRSRCKNCKGSEICEHERIRSQCKNCKGGCICKHGCIRSVCKKCKGGSICEHGTVRTRCADCKGGSICNHNRVRSQCKDCKGGCICEHGCRKITCKSCKGSGICEHDRVRSRCKKCKGSSICEHNKYKSACKSCGGSSLCSNIWCESHKISKAKPYCSRCYSYLFPDEPISRNYRSKEIQVVEDIQKHLDNNYSNLNLFVSKNKSLGACSKRRPDCYIERDLYGIIIEIDENSHNTYDEMCENRRICELWEDINYRDFHIIRFNPDKYIDEIGNTVKPCFGYSKTRGQLIIYKERYKQRLTNLLERIDHCIHNPPNKSIETHLVCFNN